MRGLCMSCTNVLEVCPAGSFLSKCEKKLPLSTSLLKTDFFHTYLYLSVSVCVCGMLIEITLI